MEIKNPDTKTFESIKHIDANGTEFWLARELMEVLDYANWQNFKRVIDTAKVACKISQQNVADHFVDVPKTVEMPVGGKKRLGNIDVNNSEKKTKPKTIPDYDFELTRYACYLIVMNGDPRKPIIANGQTYFAVKTRQQEYQDLFNQLSEDEKRLFLRADVKQKNIILAEHARNAGVITGLEFALFQDAGYRGLYGGETRAMIASRKKVKENEEILDYMGSEELAANLFRITQTDAAIKREQPTNAQDATSTHYKIGKIVRGAIEQAGGTMPEQLPTPEKSTKQIESELRKRIKTDDD